MADIVGREAELRRIEAAFDGLGDGGRFGLLIEGPAGIGKSTIWAEAAQMARRRGWLVLSARPAESESQLTLGVLADLLGPVADADVASLPVPQRRALDGALLRDDLGGAAPESRVLGTAVRSLLERLAARRPVLLAIDDLQWADGASAAVLSYAARRLDGVPVGLLLARRTPEPVPLDLGQLLPDDRLVRIEVAPMSLGAMHSLLAARMGSAPARATMVRVQEASGGNPLFALEIARVLREQGEPPAGEPLPVPADIHELLRARLAAIAPAARGILLDLAILGTADDARLAAVERRDVEDELAAAEATGLIRRDRGSLAFVHPLYAAAALASAGPADRREAHGRIAAGAATVEERARHRALATQGADPTIAAELDEGAREARGRGASTAAAELLRLAIERTPAEDTAELARRRIGLADELKRAGDPQAAIRELDAVAAGPDRLARARARLVLATIRFETEASTGPAVELATQALADAAGDTALEAHAYGVLAAVDWDDISRHEGYVERARSRLAQLPDADPTIEALILQVWCGNDVRTGRPLSPVLVARALELERLVPAPAVSDRFSAALGTWLKSLDRFDEARHWLEVTRQAALDEGDDGSMPYALAHLPELEVWSGHWERAEAVAREHLDLSAAGGLESQRDQALYNLALVHVHQGREAEARAEIGEGIGLATASGDSWMLSGTLPLLGFLELSLGHAEAAVAPLTRGHELRVELGSAAPMRAGTDLVEALVATGRLDRAEAMQADVDERAVRFGRRSSLATAARSRALVLASRGRLEEARSALASALEHHAAAPWPFEQARTLLVLGQVRRRLRERGAARDAFAAARAEFDRLGAPLWAARAEAELARTGIRRGSGLELTEGERRVAELVAAGKTNREVAAALFMSPKTVDANLGRAYAKLGIRSRAELGATIARRAQT